ncbi:MAG: hypothetical protein HOK49_01485 [Opitutae bacterium]|nr:hypothetical protein [Opitutae bacterium]MBT6461186.1 hypothetical protein [Opitutae bacterium]MBT7852651.1 hypothetical protein [Opitutae bacterium]
MDICNTDFWLDFLEIRTAPAVIPGTDAAVKGNYSYTKQFENGHTPSPCLTNRAR